MYNTILFFLNFVDFRVVVGCGGLEAVLYFVVLIRKTARRKGQNT